MKAFDDSPANALKYAYRLLALRDRSTAEVAEKLARKGFTPGTTNEAIARLKEQGYLDDLRTAETLKRTAVQYRRLGKNGVRAYLVSKGIDGEVADEVSGLEEDYLDTARLLAQRRMRLMQDLDKETVRRRLWGLLSRRGFSAETILNVLNNLLKEE